MSVSQCHLRVNVYSYGLHSICSCLLAHILVNLIIHQVLQQETELQMSSTVLAFDAYTKLSVSVEMIRGI